MSLRMWDSNYLFSSSFTGIHHIKECGLSIKRRRCGTMGYTELQGTNQLMVSSVLLTICLQLQHHTHSGNILQGGDHSRITFVSIPNQ